MPNTTPSEIELSIVMPCLNEAETLPTCIAKAKKYLSSSGIIGEVIIADNGSTDGSPTIAKEQGARVVAVQTKGYGAALMGGIHAANGKFVIMGDADDSYDFSALDAFVEKLREGNQLVMGNRFRGGILPGAMPPLHRYLGNPVLSRIGRMFFKSNIGDFHCGLRGFDRKAILALDLRTTGMEFASEMVVKSTLNGLRIAEVPTKLHPDGRHRPPHLRSWRDGWRHLRFLLMYSPRWLFLYPGLLLLSVGLLGMALLIPGPIQLASVTFDVFTLLLAGAGVTLGVQVLIFSVLARQVASRNGLLPKNEKLDKLMNRISLESMFLAGIAFAVLGLLGILYGIYLWKKTSFGPLSVNMMRLLVPSVTAVVVGVQITAGSFFRGILDLKTRSE